MNLKRNKNYNNIISSFKQSNQFKTVKDKEIKF